MSGTRRTFLKQAGATTAAIHLGAPAVLAQRGANDKVNVACIGLGVRGGTLNRLVSRFDEVLVTWVCDVYQPHIEKGVQQSRNRDINTTVDYLEVLADESVDAVVIATPDHWHSRMVIDAANAGKDVYIEKGWTRTIDEAKAMRKAIRDNNVVMQLGHQSRGLPAGVRGKQLINEGVLGEVTWVETGRLENRACDEAIWRWYGWYNQFERPDEKEVIEQLDWERWLGPVGERPFSMEHFWHWRCYWDYGTGISGDLLSHELDFVQSLLNHGIPDTCMCTGQNNLLHDGREVPDTWHTVYQFEEAKRSVDFVCSMNSAALPQPPVFHGKDAVMRFDSIAQSVSHFEVFPENADMYGAKLEEGTLERGEPFMEYDEDEAPEVPSIMQDFINCVQSRKKTMCNEDEAFIEAATIIMAVEAYKQRKEVRWDHNTETII